jgi:DNA invertase Pin-like site-specific DNA recombinase
MLHLYVAFSEKERRMIPIRTKARAHGVKLGGENEQSRMEKAAAAERALRPVIEQIRADGTTSANAIAIAIELNRKRIATPTGGKWHAQTVIRALGRLEATP